MVAVGRDGVILRKGQRGTYRYVRDPGHPLATADGYVAEHRAMAWDAGLITDPETSDHVHHINGDPLDNRLENLVVLTPAEHRKRHAAEDGTLNQYGWHPPRPEVCQLDGCDLPTARGDLCTAHATRLQRHGDPLHVTKVTATTIAPYRLVPLHPPLLICIGCGTKRYQRRRQSCCPEMELVELSRLRWLHRRSA